MGKSDSEPILTDSLLDRLTERKSETGMASSYTRSASMQRLKRNLKRDLEWLLNSRRTVQLAPDELCELNRSVYHYGLPDISSVSVHSMRDRLRLQSVIEATLKQFEPRIEGAKVTMEAPATDTRILRFRIDGLLRTDPVPEYVSFDTFLEVSSGEYQVK